MPRAIRIYVRTVDAVNQAVGRVVMYLVLVMMGILLFSSASRGLFNVSYIWVVEMAQFTMAAYYLLGGGYSLKHDFHVRMDLFYTRWSDRTKAVVDVFTILFLTFYLVILLIGGISSTQYALEYAQRNYSSWAPLLSPIKIIMVLGIFLMLLQAIATFFKDLAAARGAPLA